MAKPKANNDPISSALGMAPMPDKPKLVLGTIAIDDNSDYEYARQNIYGVIETGANALDALAQVAAQTQHPRAYEVLANLVKTMVEANKDLLNLRKTKIDIEKASGEDMSGGMGGNKVQNNLFVGSTAELQKFLKDMKNGGQG
jgi:hypothetical protein